LEEKFINLGERVINSLYSLSSLLDDLRKVKSFDMSGVVVNFEVVKK
jgi:hypothetical protein